MSHRELLALFLGRITDLIDQGVTVDNIEAACKRFDDLQTNYKKRLTDGRMKNVAFLLDPDNYWVEVVQNERFTGQDNF